MAFFYEYIPKEKKESSFKSGGGKKQGFGVRVACVGLAFLMVWWVVGNRLILIDFLDFHTKLFVRPCYFKC